MNSATAQQLLDLNRRFYAEFADSFAATRESPQPGFARLLPFLPEPCQSVLDVGCGNGRFGRYLNQHQHEIVYTGIDFTLPLLEAAAQAVDGRFVQRDLSRAEALDELGLFDLCVCLATMQHIPGRQARLALLQGMASCLRPSGRLFLANWQFLDSKRQRRKIVPWHEAGVDEAGLEEGDCLLTWQRDGRGQRYVHQVDAAETAWLAARAGLAITAQFRSDGREGNLNLYTVLGHVG